MLSLVGAVGPAVALGVSLVYCGKSRDKVKKPSLTPGSIKSTVNSKRSKKSSSKTASQSTLRSTKEQSSKSKSTASKKKPVKEAGRTAKKSSRENKSSSKKSKTSCCYKTDKSKKMDKKEKPKEEEKKRKKEKEGHNEQKVDAPFKFCDLKEKFATSSSLGAALQTVEMKMTPSELSWNASGGLHQVHIINNSGERRAIKAKCTDNLIYRVHPVHGFVAPGESFKVDVLRNNAANKSDVLVFLTTKAEDKKEARECFVDKTQPTEMLVLPLLPERVEG